MASRLTIRVVSQLCMGILRTTHSRKPPILWQRLPFGLGRRIGASESAPSSLSRCVDRPCMLFSRIVYHLFSHLTVACVWYTIDRTQFFESPQNEFGGGSRIPGASLIEEFSLRMRSSSEMLASGSVICALPPARLFGPRGTAHGGTDRALGRHNAASTAEHDGAHIPSTRNGVTMAWSLTRRGRLLLAGCAV